MSFQRLWRVEVRGPVEGGDGRARLATAGIQFLDRHGVGVTTPGGPVPEITDHAVAAWAPTGEGAVSLVRAALDGHPAMVVEEKPPTPLA